MWRLWIWVIFIIIAVYACTAEYKAIKKYYPDLSFSEYLILNDKLRITPYGE